MIIVSAVALALDTPLADPNNSLVIVIDWIDTITTLVFIFEASAKIIAYGFLLNGKDSYLRKPDNFLDFVILIFSILAISPMSDDLRAFKAFRVLRIISRNEGLTVAVRALWRGLPNIINVTLIMILFFLIFGVIFVSQFKGEFYFCSDNAET